MSRVATCISCDSPIEWAVTGKGHRIPLDLGTVPVDAQGALVLIPGVAGTQMALSFGPAVLAVAGTQSVSTQRAKEMIEESFDARLSHFATCPKAAEHRRGRR